MDWSQAWQNFHFLRPEMFWALLPILWLAYQGRKQSGSLAAWQKVVSPELLDYLKVGKSSKAKQALLWMSVLAAVLMVIAMAGPVWKKLPQPVYAEQSALVVAMDLSKSMDAADLKPSRLTRAKQKLTDLLHLRDEGQAGLVVFAGSAFVVTPLTDDSQTILSQLQGLSTDIMPVQGGDLDTGLAKALELLTQSAVKHGRILLLTDSNRYSEAMVAQVVQAGHSIDVIGVGTTDGAPIPQQRGGFMTDAGGNIVIAKLDEDALRHLALLGQGVYHRLSVDDSDISRYADVSVQALWQNEAQDKSLSTTHDTWQEEGYWLLLPAMLLLLPMFRKGMLVIALMLMLQPTPSEAGVWQDLWQTSDKQGEVLMQQKDYQSAAQKFKNPRWKSAAAYKNQDYQAALDMLQAVEPKTAEDWYNQGNALAKLGQIDAAIAAYDKALSQNANHADALANKKLLQIMKEEQQKQQDEQHKDEQGKDDQDKGQQGDAQQQDKQGDSSDAKQPQQGDKGQDQQSQNQENQGQPQNSDEQDDSAAQQAGQSNTDNTEQDKENQAAQEKVKQDKNKDDAEQDKQAQAQQSKQQDKRGEANQAQGIQEANDDVEKAEAQQVFEQQLRRVPDDPSGLLRRKFLYQYKRQTGQAPKRGEQW